MHVAGSQNTAAGFPLPARPDTQRKVQLKLRDDILTSPIEFNLKSTDVTDEEHLCFLLDEEEESKQKLFAMKTHSKQHAIDEHEEELSPKVTEVVKIPLNSAVYSLVAIKEKACFKNEHDSDPLPKALKQLRILGYPQSNYGY